MASLGKRFLKSALGRGLLSRLASGYLVLVERTVRWRVERPTETEALFAERRPFVACFWHGRMIGMTEAWPYERARFHMLISQHRDGMLIAKAVERRGFSTIAGSSRRGGAAALVAARKRLEAGEWIGITPDGPRGPRMRAKPGAVTLAAVAGVPLVPVSCAVAGQRLLGSWDRMALTPPFSRGLILFGEPINVASEADSAVRERTRLALETSLNRLTERADRELANEPVAPAVLDQDARA